MFVSLNKYFRTDCDTANHFYGNNNLGKSLAIDEKSIGKSLAIDEKSIRLKRANPTQKNFLIKYLIVLDKTVVDVHKSIYQNLDNENIHENIKIMYSYLVNGV